MTRNQETELIHLTQQCWQHYRQLNVDFMLSYCDENITWIGAEQNEFIIGFENLKQNFADLLHLRRNGPIFLVLHLCKIPRNIYMTINRDFHVSHPRSTNMRNKRKLSIVRHRLDRKSSVPILVKQIGVSLSRNILNFVCNFAPDDNIARA